MWGAWTILEVVELKNVLRLNTSCGNSDRIPSGLQHLVCGCRLEILITLKVAETLLDYIETGKWYPAPV